MDQKKQGVTKKSTFFYLFEFRTCLDMRVQARNGVLFLEFVPQTYTTHVRLRMPTHEVDRPIQVMSKTPIEQYPKTTKGGNSNRNATTPTVKLSRRTLLPQAHLAQVLQGSQSNLDTDIADWFDLVPDSNAPRVHFVDRFEFVSKCHFRLLHLFVSNFCPELV